MIKHCQGQQTQSGFTLVEMGIVLTIVALLLGTLLPKISAQIEQQRRAETRNQLSEIQQALFGFALLNGRFPCPMLASITNPANAGYGVEAATCTANAAAEGLLPWKTLGVSETDAWGTKRTKTADAWNGYWRYRTDRNFSNAAVPFTLGTGFSADALSIYDNGGNIITTTTERPIAIVYSTGPNFTPDGKNTVYEGAAGTYQSDVPTASFDDMLVWISRPLLFNRMVAAGKLP